MPAKPADQRSPKPADPFIGKVIFGCRLERRIGAGATAVVYAGERLADHLKVAVKLLTSQAARDPENIARNQREVEVSKQVAHPNVAVVYSCGQEHGVHGLVMELVEGASMEAVITAKKRLPWRDAAHLIAQVAAALEHLGTTGIIHRDIKPANILLTRGGVAKLIDLGFAKAGEVQGQEGLTMVGTAMGSPAYMPPEQVTNAKGAGHAADVYSLGATFFHSVTGQPPFTGRTAHEVMIKVVREVAPTPRSIQRDIPAGVDALITWAMAKQPEDRPASASEFAAVLSQVIERPDDASRIRSLRRKRSGIVLGVVTAVLATLVVGLLFWMLLRHGRHPAPAASAPVPTAPVPATAGATG